MVAQLLGSSLMRCSFAIARLLSYTHFPTLTGVVARAIWLALARPYAFVQPLALFVSAEPAISWTDWLIYCMILSPVVWGYG